MMRCFGRTGKSNVNEDEFELADSDSADECSIDSDVDDFPCSENQPRPRYIP